MKKIAGALSGPLDGDMQPTNTCKYMCNMPNYCRDVAAREDQGHDSDAERKVDVGSAAEAQPVVEDLEEFGRWDGRGCAG